MAPRAAVLTAAATAVCLVPEDEDSGEIAMRNALATRYNTVRPFLALLGESKALGAASGSSTGPRASCSGSAEDECQGTAAARGARQAGAVGVAQSGVRQPRSAAGGVDRDAYVVCVLEQLHRALTRRDIFSSPPHRWSDPRARYSFTATVPAAGALRPLRDPDTPELDEDEDDAD